jgi:hypothetical protein
MSSPSSTPRSTPPSQYCSRTPSPFELGEARRVVLQRAEAQISSLDLSAGVRDAYELQLRRQDSPARTPSPGPSLAPSRRSSNATASATPGDPLSRTHSHAPMLAEAPADVERAEEPTCGLRVMALAASVSVMFVATALVSAIIVYIYSRSKKAS